MTSPSPQPLPLAVRIGTLLKHTHTGEVFKVKCNCASVKPRTHTLRYVKANLGQYVVPTTQEVIDGPIL